MSDYIKRPIPVGDCFSSHWDCFAKGKADTYMNSLEIQLKVAKNTLGEIYIITGADPDIDADEPWRLAPFALEEVKRLRKEYDDMDDEMVSILNQLHDATHEIERLKELSQLREG